MPSPRLCDTCHAPAANPQRRTRWTTVAYKMNGWVGTTFVPWDRKWKSPKERTVTQCGVCYVREEIEVIKEGGKDVTELEAYLISIAEKEVALRQGKATPKGKHSNSKVARNGHRRNGRLTADQATNFDAVDLDRADALEAKLSCECRAYVTILTFDRWLALGRPVRKGQKAIPDTRPGLFCECQVSETASRVAALSSLRTEGTEGAKAVAA